MWHGYDSWCFFYQGKADDRDGNCSTFQIDVAQVEKILQFVSIPPEDGRKKNDRYWAIYLSVIFCLPTKEKANERDFCLRLRSVEFIRSQGFWLQFKPSTESTLVVIYQLLLDCSTINMAGRWSTAQTAELSSPRSGLLLFRFFKWNFCSANSSKFPLPLQQSVCSFSAPACLYGPFNICTPRYWNQFCILSTQVTRKESETRPCMSSYKGCLKRTTRELQKSEQTSLAKSKQKMKLKNRYNFKSKRT